MKIAKDPPYSNLKQGKKPTYREWVNSTIKKKHISKPVSIDSKRDENKNVNFENINNNNIKKKIIKTKTIKYNLGKKGKKVSVLIKNNTTRKKISEEHNKLKQTNIPDIKEYLRQKNFIKAGTRAPNDVLVKMYEDTKLSGDITNKNKENLLHNFLSIK